MNTAMRVRTAFFASLMTMVVLPLPVMTQGRGRGQTWEKYQRKCGRFVNCHDARDGRRDGRGPRRGRNWRRAYSRRYDVRRVRRGYPTYVRRNTNRNRVYYPGVRRSSSLNRRNVRWGAYRNYNRWSSRRLSYRKPIEMKNRNR